jgi:membrane protein implicated in regulation of membrane protease activity
MKMARKAITALLVALAAVVGVAFVLAATSLEVSGVEFWAFAAVAVAVGWAWSRRRGHVGRDVAVAAPRTKDQPTAS